MTALDRDLALSAIVSALALLIEAVDVPLGHKEEVNAARLHVLDAMRALGVGGTEMAPNALSAPLRGEEGETDAEH